MFIRAVEGKNRSVIYIADDGSRVVRSGGSPSWRANNPGNMRKGKSRAFGAIGFAVKFSVFPDYKTGREADRRLLTTTYRNYTLHRLPTKYAPQKENDVFRYRRLLKKLTGFDLKRKIRDLDAKDVEVLLDAIQRIEGWKVGTEVTLGPPKPIIDVKRDKKGRIVGYLIEELGWLSPTQTVNGILSGDIDGVVVYRGERCYVRTRPDGLPDNRRVVGHGRIDSPSCRASIRTCRRAGWRGSV